MMLNPARHSKPDIAIMALVVVLASLPASLPAHAAGFRDSLVVCAPRQLPVRANINGHALVRQIGDDRFLAPTRPAMFFSRPGDRCAWHAARRGKV